MSEKEETAASFGYTLSFFNSDKELRNLLDKATKQNWSPSRFTAEFQNTRWFRKHSESYRKYIALKKSDPATFRERVRQVRAQLRSLSNDMGAVGMSGKTLTNLAHEALKFGWNQDQIESALRPEVHRNNKGRYEGQAGTWHQQFQQILSAYNVNVSQKHMGSWVRGALRGTMNADYVTQYAIQHAMSKYPGVADRLRAGETLDQIADPYRQSYANVLEVNPEAVSLDDPLIQRALQARSKKGKPTTMSIWQFENRLRHTDRWLKTDNAQDQMLSAGKQVLSDMGLLA